MNADRISILGLPVNNFDINETVEHVMKFIDQYTPDQAPQYIGTLNIDFLNNTYGWGWNSIRNPEVLNLLRNAFLITPDGTPIVWLSKLLDAPLKERVTGVDLLPYLAAALGERGKSVYLLGGEDRVANVTGVILTSLYHGLKIVGIATPPITIQGADLVNALERDELIIEQINAAKPDVLFISLGNPKQEIWFNRVKSNLRVPISIGIGGSYMMAIGAIPRAPHWMQKYGLEWFYRFLKEPKRLWDRYLLGGTKFFIKAFPLVIYHKINKLLSFSTSKKEEPSFTQMRLFISKTQTLALLSLPSILDRKGMNVWLPNVEEAFLQDVVIFDFSKVSHLSLESLAVLQSLFRKVLQVKKPFFILKISGDVRLMLQLNHVWDMFAPYAVSDANEILTRIFALENEGFFESIQQEDWVKISFFGKLKNSFPYEEYLTKLATILLGKNCLVDFTYCTLIENAGFTFLLQLKKNMEKRGNKLEMTGLTSTIKQQFKMVHFEF